MTCPVRRYHQGLPWQLQRGFTLIELMLALALTALLLGMLSAGVYSVVRDWDDNAAGLDETLDETITILQVERALQGAFAHSYRDPDSLGRFVFFDGQSDQLSWVSSVSPQRNTGLTAWRLYSVSDEGLYLRLAPALTTDPSQRLDDAEPILLLPGYEAEFNFLYEDLDFSKQWEQEWIGAEQMVLPLAVHVLLRPQQRDSPKQVLDIIAALAGNQHRSLRPSNQVANPQGFGGRQSIEPEASTIRSGAEPR